MRRIALDGLSLVDSVIRRDSHKSKPRVQFLVLHHVFQDETAAFRKFLSRLQQDFQFISYSRAVTRILEGRVDRPYLTFSFDDGQKCSLQAAEILKEFRASACFFLCPSIIGVTDLKAISQFCSQQLRHAPVEFMNWRDVETLQDQGHEIGGHTMSHLDLGIATPSQVEDEVHQSFAELAKRTGAPQHFSWPYGQFHHFTQQAAENVFRSGFSSCASGVRGSHAGAKVGGSALDATQLCLYRDSMVASWPVSHVQYFLRRAAHHPIANELSWPKELAPKTKKLSQDTSDLHPWLGPADGENRSGSDNKNPTSINPSCESHSTPSPCDPAAA